MLHPVSGAMSGRDGRLQRSNSASLDEPEVPKQRRLAPLRTPNTARPPPIAVQRQSFEVQLTPLLIDMRPPESQVQVIQGPEEGAAKPVVDDEEEDVCCICLEPYASDNPQCFGSCKHHFHYSCVLSWKQRSNLCPMCNGATLSNAVPAGVQPHLQNSRNLREDERLARMLHKAFLAEKQMRREQRRQAPGQRENHWKVPPGPPVGGGRSRGRGQHGPGAVETHDQFEGMFMHRHAVASGSGSSSSSEHHSPPRQYGHLRPIECSPSRSNVEVPYHLSVRQGGRPQGTNRQKTDNKEKSDTCLVM